MTITEEILDELEAKLRMATPGHWGPSNNGFEIVAPEAPAQGRNGCLPVSVAALEDGEYISNLNRTNDIAHICSLHNHAAELIRLARLRLASLDTRPLSVSACPQCKGLRRVWTGDFKPEESQCPTCGGIGAVLIRVDIP